MGYRSNYLYFVRALRVGLNSRLCGYPPFSSDNDVAMYRQILRGKYDFPSPEWDHVSKDAKDFISKLLIVDPEKRYTAKQVCFEHVNELLGVNASLDAL